MRGALKPNSPLHITAPVSEWPECEAIMVTIGMNYEVLAGKEEVFEKAFAHVLTRLEGADGHESSRLLRDVHQVRYYAIHSRWSDDKRFRTFVASKEFSKVTNWRKEQILASHPEHIVYRT